MARKNIKFCTVDPNNKRRATLNGDAFKGSKSPQNVYLTGYATATMFQGGMKQGSTTEWIQYTFSFGGKNYPHAGTSTGTMGLGFGDWGPAQVPVGTTKTVSLGYVGCNDSRFPPQNLDYWIRESATVLQFWEPTQGTVYVNGTPNYEVSDSRETSCVVSWDMSTVDPEFGDQLVGYNIYCIKTDHIVNNPTLAMATKLNVDVLSTSTTSYNYEFKTDKQQYIYFLVEALGHSTTDIEQDTAVTYVEYGTLVVPDLHSIVSWKDKISQFDNYEHDTLFQCNIQIKDATNKHHYSVYYNEKEGPSGDLAVGVNSFSWTETQQNIKREYSFQNQSSIKVKVVLDTINVNNVVTGTSIVTGIVSLGSMIVVSRYVHYSNIARAIREVGGYTGSMYPSQMASKITYGILDTNKMFNADFDNFSCIQDFLNIYDNGGRAKFWSGGFIINSVANAEDWTSVGKAGRYIYNLYSDATVNKDNYTSAYCIVDAAASASYVPSSNLRFYRGMNITGFKAQASTYNMSNFDIIQIDAPNCSVVNDYCLQSAKTLQAVMTPAASTYGTGCFRYCEALSSVQLDNAQTLNNQCFAACSAVSNLYTPIVTTILQSVFSNCITLTDIEFPAATYASKEAFHNCSNLKTAAFGSAFSKFSSTGCFSGCTNLKLVVLQYPSVVAIDATTFSNTNDYFVVKVPASLVESYKVAANWSKISGIASRIKAL